MKPSTSNLPLTLIAISFFFNLFDISTTYEWKAESGFKQQAEIYAQEGYINRKKGNIQEAIKYFQKATYLNPGFAFPHNELGMLYESKGWLDRAEREYKEAIRIDPQFLSAYMNLALFYESKKDIKQAIFYWKKRIELAPRKDKWTDLAMKKLKQYAPDELVNIININPKVTKEISDFEKAKREVTSEKEERKEVAILKTKPLEVEKKKITLKPKPVKKKIVRKSPVFEEEKLRQAEEVTEETIKKIERDILLAKEKKVRMLLKSAREFLQHGEFELALDKLYLAQELDPGNIEVELLIDAARLAQK